LDSGTISIGGSEENSGRKSKRSGSISIFLYSSFLRILH
jgi:hypothetical protein